MDSVFFVLSKIGGALLSPGTVLLLLLCLGFGIQFTRFQKRGTYLLGFTLTASFLIALLPIDEWLLAPLESAFPTEPALPDKVDGIIILGGAIDTLASADWGQTELNGSAERLTAGVMLAKRYPNARILFSGGSGLVRFPNLREADFARHFFISQGLPENSVFFESASRNTYENAVNTKQMVQPKSDETWVLITSAAHMPRSIGTFCEQNWSVVPWPVDHHTSPTRRWRLEFDFSGNLSSLESVLHEYVGLIMYRITGKTPQLLASNCQVGE